MAPNASNKPNSLNIKAINPQNPLPYIIHFVLCPVLHEMQKQCPQTNFIPAPPMDNACACNECSYMRLNTLEKLYDCLKNESPEITVDPEIAEKAVKPIQRMLEISAKLGL